MDIGLSEFEIQRMYYLRDFNNKLQKNILVVDQFKDDVLALVNAGYPMTRGWTINISLYDLYKLCPRIERSRSKYDGLKSYLKVKFEVELNILL